jgi:hypothetical protein
MDDGGKEGSTLLLTKEHAIEDMASRLELLAEHDPERYIHTPVYFLSHDNQTDQPVRTQVGNIFQVGADNTFIFIIKEQQKRRIFAVTPSDAPAAEEEKEVEDFYNFIGFNREDAVGRFDENFTYSAATLTYKDPIDAKTLRHANLADVFEDRGRLLAKNGVNQQDTVSAKMSAAFEHGKQVLRLPEGKW